jgi:hypothetical protein
VSSGPECRPSALVGGVANPFCGRESRERFFNFQIFDSSSPNPRLSALD